VDRVCGVHGNSSHKLRTPDVALADVLTPKHLTRALNEAQVQRLVTPAELALLTR
jgi:hypothetical protein